MVTVTTQAGAPTGTRPSEVFNESSEVILQCLRDGLTPFAACRKAGVIFFTYRSWIHNGTGPLARQPYAAFAHEVAKIQREVPIDEKALAEVLLPRGRRPQALTGVQQDAIVQVVQDGGSHFEAADAAGITLNTLYSWLRMGGYPKQVSRFAPVPDRYVEDPFKSFVARFREAETNAAIEVANIAGWVS